MEAVDKAQVEEAQAQQSSAEGCHDICNHTNREVPAGTQGAAEPIGNPLHLGSPSIQWARALVLVLALRFQEVVLFPLVPEQPQQLRLWLLS